MPTDLSLLKCTEIRTELDDITTVTPDLYSKICSNGNISSNLNTNTTNGGSIVAKMNDDDTDEFSVVIATETDNINV